MIMNAMKKFLVFVYILVVLFHNMRNVIGEHPTSHPGLQNKVIFGYQGWFEAKSINDPKLYYRHWTTENFVPDVDNLVVDFWPDMSEFPKSSLYETNMHYANGDPVLVYDSNDDIVLKTHFDWMNDYGLDGIALQRFSINCVPNTTLFEFRNNVLQNTRIHAERTGKSFYVMYDITGAKERNFAQNLIADWKFLVDSMKITSSPSYIYENDLPVLCVWGCGFTSRVGSVDQWVDLIDTLRTDPVYGVFLIGGVPYHWATENDDSKPDFLKAYMKFDSISPWSVGRWSNHNEFDYLYDNVVKKDLALCQQANIQYAPVAWPGFSWSNLKNVYYQDSSKFNQIPRDGGKFFWYTASKYLDLQPSWHYIAMFDEVNEGTAMYKVLSKRNELPQHASLVYLDIDGYELSSDFYLQLAGNYTHHAKEMIQM